MRSFRRVPTFCFLAFLHACRIAADFDICLEKVGGDYGRGVESTALLIPPGTEDVYVAKQDGSISNNDPSSDWLNVRNLVGTIQNEQGLVSAEFHYNYGTVGATGEHLLYLMFLGTGTNNDTHVVEYNVAASTTRMIFHLYQPTYIHNGGTIEFGKAPDNNLYITLGDSGGQNWVSSQNPMSLLGKVLRIDVSTDDFPNDPMQNYGVPNDNPFVGQPGWRPEVWAYGLRNPFACNIDKGPGGSGDMYCADVGRATYEEINHIVKGGNYGWREFEGTQCSLVAPSYYGNQVTQADCDSLRAAHAAGSTDLHWPLFQYRNENGASAMGTPVYRGSDSRAYGKLFLSDYFNCIDFDSTPGVYEYSARERCNTLTSPGIILNPGANGDFVEMTGRHTEPQQYVEKVGRVYCQTAQGCRLPGYTKPRGTAYAVDHLGEVYFTYQNSVYRTVDPAKCPSIDTASYTGPQVPPPVDPTPDFPASPEHPLKQPEVVCPTSGEPVDLYLGVSHWSNELFSFNTRSFNQQIPGPTLVVAPGETFSITLHNELGANAAPPAGGLPMNGYLHSPNTTGLHVHGLMVSPSDPEDNVFRSIQPGESHTFTYRLDSEHPSGTYWYHPHHHGSSGIQLEGGAAGAIVVLDREGANTMPLNLREFVIVFQHVGFGGTEMNSLPDIDAASGSTLHRAFSNIAGLSHYVTVNGQYYPVLQVAPQEAFKLRLVNAGGSFFVVPELSSSSAVQCTMHLLAMDGAYRTSMAVVDRVVIPPGSRADVVIQCMQAGTAEVTSGKAGTRNLNNFEGFVGPLMRLEVSSAGLPPHATTLPASPPPRSAYFDDLTTEAVSHTHQVEFEMVSNSINSVAFNHQSQTEVPIGSISEWTVRGKTDSENHPYHQHIHHFQLMSFPGSGESDSLSRTGMEVGDWRDTVPASDMGDTVIRWRSHHFTGELVHHCHIASHADKGMMAVASITGQSTPVSQSNVPVYRPAAFAQCTPQADPPSSTSMPSTSPSAEPSQPSPQPTVPPTPPSGGPLAGGCDVQAWTGLVLACPSVSGCTGLVRPRNVPDTCASFCQSQGLGCAAAFEEVSNDCNIKSTYDCLFDFATVPTGDMICQCEVLVAPTNSPSVAPSTGYPSPGPTATSPTGSSLSLSPTEFDGVVKTAAPTLAPTPFGTDESTTPISVARNRESTLLNSLVFWTISVLALLF